MLKKIPQARAPRWPILLSTGQLSQYLGVCRRLIQIWNSTGYLPRPVDLNGARITRWRRTDIDAWLASRPGRPSAQHRMGAPGEN